MTAENTHTQAQRVLVTGANGFIGSHLCRSLLAHGFTVIAGVRSGANLENLENVDVTYAYGDVTKHETLTELIAGADVVLHNAGLVKSKSAARMTEVNTGGTEALYDVCVKSKHVKRFVFISSMAASGPSQDRPRVEDDEPAPLTHYGWSKLNAEKALLKRAHELNVQIVRPPGVYGPGDREILTFFQTVRRGIRPSIGNIGRRLNMVYVDDLAEGVSRLLEHKLPSGNIYFLAESQSYTFAELMDHIGAAVDRRGISLPVPGWAFKSIGAVTETASKLVGATPMLTLEKAREVLSSWEVSVARARADFDFAPAISFPEGARLTAAWYRDHGWLK